MLRKVILVFLVLAFVSPSIAWLSRKAAKPPIRTIIIDPGHGGVDGGAEGDVSREALIALKISLKLRDIIKATMPDVQVLMTRETDNLPGFLSNKTAALKYRADYANQNTGDLFISIHLNASPDRYERRQTGTKTVIYYTYTGKGKKRKKIKNEKEVPVYQRFKLPKKAYGTQTYILSANWYDGKKSAVKSDAEYNGEETVTDSALLNMDPVEARIRASQYTKYYFQKSYNLASLVEQEFAKQGRRSWGVLQRNWEAIWVLQATAMPSILVETGFVDYPEEELYLDSEKGSTEVAEAISNAVKLYKKDLEDKQKKAEQAAANATEQ